MYKRWFTILLAIALSIGMLASGAFAFSDLQNVTGQEKITELKDKGIINGVAKGRFAPHKVVTTEQAVSMIVKGLDLNLNAFLFVKQPEASDYFTNIPNDAWYAKAFVTAHLNGVPLAKDIKPGVPVTREQFVNMLMNAVYTIGDYAWIEIFMEIKDADKVTEGYMDAIQKALIAKIAQVDKKGNFRPLHPITRAEAAVMLHNAIEFVAQHPGQETPAKLPDDPHAKDEVTMTLTAVNEDVQKVTLNWGQKPNSGYGLTIVGIDFASEETAIVKYQLRFPQPGFMYADVIVEPQASVYVGSNIKHVELQYVQ